MLSVTRIRSIQPPAGADRARTALAGASFPQPRYTRVGRPGSHFDGLRQHGAIDLGRRRRGYHQRLAARSGERRRGDVVGPGDFVVRCRLARRGRAAPVVASARGLYLQSPERFGSDPDVQNAAPRSNRRRQAGDSAQPQSSVPSLRRLGSYSSIAPTRAVPRKRSNRPCSRCARGFRWRLRRKGHAR